MKVLFNSIFTLTIAITLSNCKKLDEYTQFNLNYNETIVIPSSTSINLPLNLFTPETTTNSEAEFAINDTRKDLIEEIKLTSLSIELISPTDQDFSFLKSINIYINTDGLGEHEIAKNENVQGDNEILIELSPSTLDLQEYIKKDNFTLRLKTVTDEVLTSDHQIKVNSSFFVDAKVLGK